jgi:hypothetical protein
MHLSDISQMDAIQHLHMLKDIFIEMALLSTFHLQSATGHNLAQLSNIICTARLYSKSALK